MTMMKMNKKIRRTTLSKRLKLNISKRVIIIITNYNNNTNDFIGGNLDALKQDKVSSSSSSLSLVKKALNAKPDDELPPELAKFDKEIVSRYYYYHHYYYHQCHYYHYYH